jgi:hypothetical protein
MDVIKGHRRIWDWKTSGQEYKLWEKQRWAVQPTVYTWAAAQNGLLLPDGFGDYTFEYKVLKRSAKPSKFMTYRVTRTIRSWAWLERVVQNVATLFVTMGIEDEWPLNDHSALCSPKWCPFWDQCKGQYVDGSWA